MMRAPECIWPAGALLGEGPLWHPAENILYWIDIKRPAVHALDPASGRRSSWEMPEPIGCMAPRKRGGFVAAFKSGFAFLDLADNHIEPIGNPEPDRPDNRFNDGKCDAKGRFWAGTMDDNERQPTGWLYRLDPDLKWTRTDGPYICTNGPALSPDGITLYHTDSAGRTVYAFDLDSDGSLTHKRVFIRFREDQGYPDGMTVDRQGCLWVAHWEGWRVTRFRPDGTEDRTISLPVAQVTSCAFGDEKLKTLYITSAAIGLDPSARREQPLAGGIFRVETDVEGLPCCEFEG